MLPFSNSVVIIGGGIGGLVTALSLQKANIDCNVFEAEIKETEENSGAGIVLSINAMKVLTELDVAEKVIKQGRVINKVSLTNENGNVMSNNDLKSLTKQNGLAHICSVSIHRNRLQKILTNELHERCIQYSKRLKFIDTEKNICHFSDGDKSSYSLLIGCDGINSVVRSQIKINQPIRDAKQICYRGTLLIESDKYDQGKFIETWGNAKRFGFVNIGGSEVYWYATLRKDKYDEISSNNIKSVLTEEFSSWWGPINQIIDLQDESKILRNDLYDRKPCSTWRVGNIVLVGDAIHSTTPNIGQGAAMSIESASVLVDCLTKNDDLSEALNTYQALRESRTRKVTQASWQIGLVANMKGNLICLIRNTIFRAIPNWILNRSANKFFFAKIGV